VPLIANFVYYFNHFIWSPLIEVQLWWSPLTCEERCWPLELPSTHLLPNSPIEIFLLFEDCSNQLRDFTGVCLNHQLAFRNEICGLAIKISNNPSVNFQFDRFTVTGLKRLNSLAIFTSFVYSPLIRPSFDNHPIDV